MNKYGLYIGIMFFGVVISQFSQILLKKSALKKYDSFIKEYLNSYVIGAYSIFVLGVLINLFVLTKLPVNYIPIIEASGYVIIVIFSRIFLKELISVRKVLAMCIIMAGIAVYLM